MVEERNNTQKEGLARTSPIIEGKPTKCVNCDNAVRYALYDIEKKIMSYWCEECFFEEVMAHIRKQLASIKKSMDISRSKRLEKRSTSRYVVRTGKDLTEKTELTGREAVAFGVGYAFGYADSLYKMTKALTPTSIAKSI